MPLYAYSCPSCGEFEKFAPMAMAANPQKCPTCDRAAPRLFCSVAVVTDTSLFTGDRLGGIGNAAPFVREKYQRLADKAGIVTSGKQYMPSLAEFPGDPRAYVSSRSDIERVARERNLNVDGIVKVKADEKPPPQDGLCSKVARSHARRIQRENPGMSAEKALDLAVERHAPPRAKRIIESPNSRRPAKSKKR